jgi:hypothetical protein
MKLKLTAWLLIFVISIFTLGCSSVPDNATAAGAAAGESSNPPFSKDKPQEVSLLHKLVPEDLTVPAGTPVSIRLQNAISSASNRPGDEFAAVLDEPIVVDSKTVAPRGAAVQGRVVAARSSGRLHNSGYLRIALASVEINGKAVPVHSSSVFIAGGSHKNRDLALIGGGAGAGALIGAIAGGGKGALIGTAVGAGGGTAGAYATGKKDVSFAPERRLTFRLTQPLVAKS